VERAGGFFRAAGAQAEQFVGILRLSGFLISLLT
jgi:hypothetical protein